MHQLYSLSGREPNVRDMGWLDTPSDPSWRAKIEVELRETLAGSYSAQGADRWFDRVRAKLDGRTPRQVLECANSPQDDAVARLRALAESLRG
jgi:hypothetical protein